MSAHPLEKEAKRLMESRLKADEAMMVINEITRAVKAREITFKALNITESDFNLMWGRVERFLAQREVTVPPPSHSNQPSTVPVA